MSTLVHRSLEENMTILYVLFRTSTCLHNYRALSRNWVDYRRESMHRVRSPTNSSRVAGNIDLDGRSRNVNLKREPNITDDPEVLRLPAPYNLLSLRDLYTQIPADDAKLKRFGSDVFLNRGVQAIGRVNLGPATMPIDLPVGPDYILGSGDGLTINLSGGISQSLNRIIDREGKIALPEAGSITVAGLTLQYAKSSIESALQQQFHNEKVDVTVARLRTVRVYVVGDVQRPGAYDLSSLSTPLNALYAAGGPTSIGSLRFIRHLRGAQLIREDDLYDFLLHGIRMDGERLQSGDTLLVPPAGQQVGISGMVKRPAIYELKDGANLAEVLADAGGTTAAAQLNQILINRIQENQHRETVTLSVPSPGTQQAASQVFTLSLLRTEIVSELHLSCPTAKVRSICRVTLSVQENTPITAGCN